MEIGDIIRFALVVGFLVISAITKAKKRKKKQAKPSGYEQSQPNTSKPNIDENLQDVIDELLGKRKKAEPKKQPTPTKKILPEFSSALDSSLNPIDSYNGEEGISVTAKSNLHPKLSDRTTLSERSKLFKKVVVEENLPESILDNFDAREALIYSEIFNRKTKV